jgi:ferredoxin
MNRREFLKLPRPKNDMILVLDNENCTGCGLCAIDCPTKALTLSQNGEENTYQIIFIQKICNACGICEKSCPENCLRLVEQRTEQDRTINPIRNSSGALNPAAEQRGIISNGVKEAKIIFEDKISKCMECGAPLFPQAMVKKLESQIDTTGEQTWPFHLCPSCRMKSQFSHTFGIHR